MLTPESLCKSSRASPLLDFVKYVFSLGFSDVPNYEGLRSILVKVLNDRNMEPTFEYDWNKQQLASI